MSRATYREQLLAAFQMTHAQEREIKARISKLYEKCAADMATQLAGVDEKTLRHRRDTEYIAGLKARSRELWKEIGGETERGMMAAAERSANAFRQVYEDAAASVGMDMKGTFRSVFASAPDEAVASVLGGSVYSGKNASLSRRIWKHEARMNGDIEHVIAEGIAKGQSPVQLASALEAFVNPKAQMPDHWNEVYPMPFPLRVDYNAQRLAVTAINHAGWATMISAAKADPFAEFIHWELSSRHEVYDICDIYANEDTYGLGMGNHPIDQSPLPHPWCWCLYYADSSKSLEQIGTELGDWLHGTQPNEKLDTLFGNWQSKGLAQEAQRALGQRTPLQGNGSGNIRDLQTPPLEVMQMANDAIGKIGADFPELRSWVEGVYWGDEEGGASTTLDGRFILLDKKHFASPASAKALLDKMIATGHTGSASDPRFIIAHEIGHGLHGQAALRAMKLGQLPTSDILMEGFHQQSMQIVIDAIGNTGLEGDAAQVFAQIGDELGSRALNPLSELLAQACAMYYYGDGARPISEQMMRYLMELLR